jgi:hypothetical protein
MRLRDKNRLVVGNRFSCLAPGLDWTRLFMSLTAGALPREESMAGDWMHGFVFFLNQRVGDSGRRLMHLVPAPDSGNRRLIVFVLRRMGHRVETASGRY